MNKAVWDENFYDDDGGIPCLQRFPGMTTGSMSHQRWGRIVIIYRWVAQFLSITWWRFSSVMQVSVELLLTCGVYFDCPCGSANSPMDIYRSKINCCEDIESIAVIMPHYEKKMKATTDHVDIMVFPVSKSLLLQQHCISHSAELQNLLVFPCCCLSHISFIICYVRHHKLISTFAWG